MDSSIEIKYFFNDNVTEKQLQIKESPEDFVVQEISLDNKICSESTILNIEQYIASIKLLVFMFKEQASEEEISKWFDKTNFYEKYDLNFTEDSYFFILKSDYKTLEFRPILIKNKDLRTKIHSLLNFNFSISTKTVNDELILTKTNSHTINFTLKKVMLNTVDACKMVERNLGTSVSFAGNKDKKAVTYQRVSCKVNINAFLDFAYKFTDCTKKDYDHLRIYNFFEDIEMSEEELQVCKDEDELQVKRYKIDQNNTDLFKSCIGIFDIKKGHNIKLGDLTGNKFTIKIKNTKNSNFKNIENGFINYYGAQRFGKAGNNHVIGKCILDEDYKEAVDLIIKNSKGYKDYADGNFDDCLKKCDNMEGLIFKKLINQTDPNYKKIILGIRREIRMIYLHSYQSFLFNKDVNDFIDKKTERSFDCFLELKKMNNSFLKGGKRKVFEKGSNVQGWQEGDDFVISFELKSSCYATMALREL